MACSGKYKKVGLSGVQRARVRVMWDEAGMAGMSEVVNDLNIQNRSMNIRADNLKKWHLNTSRG